MTVRNQAIHPVLLCGGSGTRLWPLSRALYPKQVLQFQSEYALIVLTARRTQGEGFAAPLVICNEEHRFLIATLLQQIGIAPSGIVLEAEGHSTAPAAAIAALFAAQQALAREDSLLLPSDHVIPDVEAFQHCVIRGREAAGNGWIVTFCVKPIRPETGNGYIEMGAGGADVSALVAVARFVEKPDTATAEALLRDGRHCWDSGIFLCSAKTLLEEMGRFAPEVLAAAGAAFEAVQADLDFLLLDAVAYGRSPNISFDHAVMEQTDRASVLPVAFEWSDIGSWQEIWKRAPKDERDNALIDDVIVQDTSGSLVCGASKGLTVVSGLDDAVVVNTDDVVLVTKRDGAAPVKAVLERLAAEGREASTSPTPRSTGSGAPTSPWSTAISSR